MDTNGLHPLEALMRKRIVVLDGAMGTMIQQYKLSEAGLSRETFPRLERQRSQRESRAPHLTQPEVIEEIHSNYLEAGADIIETNTFSGTTIGLHDFLFQGEPSVAAKIRNFFSASWTMPIFARSLTRLILKRRRIARQAADRVANDNRAAAFCWRFDGPSACCCFAFARCKRSGVSRGHVRSTSPNLFDQAKALLEGGVDLLMVETIFDTLNAKGCPVRDQLKFLKRRGRRRAADDFGNRDRSFRPNLERTNG